MDKLFDDRTFEEFENGGLSLEVNIEDIEKSYFYIPLIKDFAGEKFDIGFTLPLTFTSAQNPTKNKLSFNYSLTRNEDDGTITMHSPNEDDVHFDSNLYCSTLDMHLYRDGDTNYYYFISRTTNFTYYFELANNEGKLNKIFFPSGNVATFEYINNDIKISIPGEISNSFYCVLIGFSNNASVFQSLINKLSILGETTDRIFMQIQRCQIMPSNDYPQRDYSLTNYFLLNGLINSNVAYFSFPSITNVGTSVSYCTSQLKVDNFIDL